VKQCHINNLNFRFLVKFYTPDPELLEEELTRSGCRSVYILCHTITVYYQRRYVVSWRQYSDKFEMVYVCGWVFVCIWQHVEVCGCVQQKPLIVMT